MYMSNDNLVVRSYMMTLALWHFMMQHSLTFFAMMSVFHLWDSLK